MRYPMTAYLRFLGAAGIAILLSGCAMSRVVSNATPSSPVGGALHVTGTVHGGQQPVAKATIQLYAVGNTANGSAATPLITQTVLTDDHGVFNITGLWDCNNTAVYGNDPLLYLVATGGNPGLGAGGNNPALALMAALGPCSTINAQTNVSVNEITTVASIYALSPFMADYAHVGAGNMAGLKNAFGTVATLVNTSTGLSPGTGVGAGVSVPVSTLYSLANAMSACINSNGSGSCDTLFAATTPTGGTAPVDTIGAFLQLAKAPTKNASTIFSLALAQPPFQPALPASPTDWALGVKLTGSGISSPTGIAIDGSGNAWIANASGASVTGLNSQGAPLSGASGYSGGGAVFGAQAVAVDRSGNVWVADTLLSAVFKLAVVNGVVQQSTKFTAALNGPVGIAIDSQNNVWLANFGDGSVTELNSNGTPMGGSPFTAGGTLQAPAGVAIDHSGNVWVTDNAASVLVKFDNNQNLLSGAGFSDAAMFAPEGVAIDSTGNAWVAGNGSSAVSLYAASGAAFPSSPLTAASLSQPAGIALDGSGVAWTTNSTATGSLTGVSSSSAMGGVGNLNLPVGVAVDASGNVWTANSGDDSVTKFVGLATPVATPLAAAVGP